MYKLRIALAALVIGAVSLGAYRAVDDAKKDAPKYTIKQVMKEAHGEDGLVKKVREGNATQADKDKLVELYIALAADKPAKGDIAVWKEKTAPIVVAAKAIAADKEGDKKLIATFNKAVACKDCHQVFK
jgi:Na+-translocating ferredoxin:NAD+ oxidoreductase RnfG subunit